MQVKIKDLVMSFTRMHCIVEMNYFLVVNREIFYTYYKMENKSCTATIEVAKSPQIIAD